MCPNMSIYSMKQVFLNENTNDYVIAKRHNQTKTDACWIPNMTKQHDLYNKLYSSPKTMTGA